MEHVFQFIKQGRQAFINLINDLSIDQLNEIPTGFNNNIIWNFGHAVIATQLLTYVRTGARPDASSVKYAAAYAKGTKPTYFVSQEEVDDLKKLALETIDQLEKDYHAGLFTDITAYSTDTYKETMSSIEQVIILTAGHDNLHYGYAIAQKRTINK
jgi:hypothetical protein